MNNLNLLRAILFLTIASATHVAAQNKFEKLPRHQINASFGRATTLALDHPNLSELNAGGLAYTYNLTRRLWVGAEWQSGFSKFDWQDSEKLKIDPFTRQRTVKLTEIPVYYTTEFQGFPYPSTNISNAPVALLPSNGFYGFQNWSIMAGYQRSGARNALRFGLGVSANQLRGRYIRFTQDYNTFQYLKEAKTLVWGTDAAIQYDYWVTPTIAVGMRLRAIFDFSSTEYHHYSAMLSVGYAIPRLRKTKVQPRA
jgi:hypothetical protein